MDFKILSTEDVLLIHNTLVRDFEASGDPISPPGVKSKALLESAVGRQLTSLGGVLKYNDAVSSAATLMYGVCCNHAFHNGNKRTALVSMLVHLDNNKLALVGTKEKDLYKLVIDVANHNLCEKENDKSNRIRCKPDEEVECITDWLRKRAKRVKRGEKQITYRQLRAILRAHGYDLKNPNGNAIDIVRVTQRRKSLFDSTPVTEYKKVSAIGYPGEGKFVAVSAIKTVRKICRLTEEDGVDSDSFYSNDNPIDEFVNRYRTILRKLANK